MVDSFKVISFVVGLFFSVFVEAQTPVYFNIVSHNEITDALKYESSSVDYNTIRPIVKEVCDTIIAKHAKYNMQLDANFIKAVLKWENAATNPNDILEWANNSPYIDIDGHNHFDKRVNPYNYSDLAKLLDSCGVTMTRKVLGSNWAKSTEIWTQYQTPKAGFTFKNFYWQPEIIWGMASPGHVNDLNVFGIWKPTSSNSLELFLQHNPDGVLTAIGGGCNGDISYTINFRTGQLVRTTDEVIANIKSIVDYIQTLPSGPNDFYTMNMLINFRDMPKIPHFADSIGVIIDGLQDYVDQGKIIWATLAEKYDLWYAQHTDPEDYFNYDCEGVTLGVDETIPNEESIAIYPNPTTDEIHFSLPQNTTIRGVEIFNLLGEKIYSQNHLHSLSLSGFENGIYLIKIENDKGSNLIKKIIKE